MHCVCTVYAPHHAGGHHHAEEAPLEYRNRLQSLAADQLAVVCKAMEMPDMRTVVYSTCSVPAACLPSHRRPPPRPRPAAPPPPPRRPDATSLRSAPQLHREESCPCPMHVHAGAPCMCMQVHREENEDVVQAALDAKSAGGWRLARVLPDWPARGLAGHACGPLCARAGHEESTNGFFVARFERNFGTEQRVGSPTVAAAKVGAKGAAKGAAAKGGAAKGGGKGAAAPPPAAPRSQEPPPGRELSEKGELLKRKRTVSTPLVEPPRPEAEQQRASWTTPEEQAAERKAQKRRRKDESRKKRKQKRKPT